MKIDNIELERRRTLWSQGVWQIPADIDTSNFDFNWRPFVYDRPYIHEFATQWQRTGGPRFVISENEGIKYCSEQVATKLPNRDNFKVLIDENIDFDYSWHPDANEPPFIYVFGNQWNDVTTEPTVEYHMSGATDRKYITDIIANIKSEQHDKWKILLEHDEIDFDFSWRPNPYEPPFIYVFGNQWNDAATEPTLEYVVDGATDRKYITDITANIKSEQHDKWKILLSLEKKDLDFDFSWRPNPYEPPFIYVFGNQWNDAATEPTLEYHMSGATDRKYINDITSNIKLVQHDKWKISNSNDRDIFDFTWRPNPYSPSQIYQWEDNGPIFTDKDDTDITDIVYMSRLIASKNVDNGGSIVKYYIETTLEDLIVQHKHEVFWALNSELNYDRFDFNWKPDNNNFRHINVFGNKLSKDISTYYVNGPAWINGNREFNYIDDYEVNIQTEIDMYYIDRGNNDHDQYKRLQSRFPDLQKTRYVNSWIHTISRCIKKSKTKLIWILSSDLNYDEFEFDFYPSNWQRNMIHVFGTQWSHWGNTYMINTEQFENDVRHLDKIEHSKNINFVRRKRAKISECLHDIVYIDFGNQSRSLEQLRNLCSDSEITTLKYSNSYANTLTTWVNRLDDYQIKQEHYIWVCTSLCDYQDFDFTWIGDPFQFDQVHVFSSKFKNSKQKFGDTFFINLNEFKKESARIKSLEDYSKRVNYIGHISAIRLEHPVIEHNYDSQAIAIKNIDSEYWPYYELVNSNSIRESKYSAVPNMWDSDQTDIIVSSHGASRIFVPDRAIDVVKSEVYDYPNIKISEELDSSEPLDIIFFSNGEPSADDNYQLLLKIIQDRQLKNRVVRVQDVVGRVASQSAAAYASNTNWYFLVNGKLRINQNFDFSWQPDRLQNSKHYIFMATNPVNNLEYGHQAIVANNKQLTLSTQVQGLDFTMDSPHEIVDMNSGIAIYNCDEWTTWRTAFREVIKLLYSYDMTDDQQTLDRLNTWLTVGNNEFGSWSIKGAKDAKDYYNQVNAELSLLMNSYDWETLRNIYDSKYHLSEIA